MCYECHKINAENSSKESKAQYNTKIVEVENTVSLVSIHKPNYHKVTTTYPIWTGVYNMNTFPALAINSPGA